MTKSQIEKLHRKLHQMAFELNHDANRLQRVPAQKAQSDDLKEVAGNLTIVAANILK